MDSKLKKFIEWYKAGADPKAQNIAEEIVGLGDEKLSHVSEQFDQFVAAFLDKSDEILFGSPNFADKEIEFFESLEVVRVPSIFRNGFTIDINMIPFLKGDGAQDKLKTLIGESLVEKSGHIVDKISQRSPHDRNHSLDNPNTVSGQNALRSLGNDTDLTKKFEKGSFAHGGDYKEKAALYPFLLFQLLSSEDEKKLFEQRQKTLKESLDLQDPELDVAPYVWRAMAEMGSNVHASNTKLVRDQVFLGAANLIKNDAGIEMTAGAAQKTWDNSVTNSHKSILNFLIGQKEINTRLIPYAEIDPEKVEISDTYGAFIDATEARRGAEQGAGSVGGRTGLGPGSKPGFKPE